ncbi:MULTISPECIES: aminoglycoside phosphotransferase family protein [unclassified Legionella]|uniref:aminoglycoside phosphotransferase family protein n=1 Tax=unclassified Legionella TaxID=2622702 RepID=UPI001E609DD4|nr:aminoglycoside phosphotransferase family protein [Legionella sp. 31fI33]MCC5015715.1 aminoglycoside phosphotransferase family protein [Legionella sp. 31fI33]
MDKLFVQNIINLYGAKGKQWLENLPQIIERKEEFWQISALKSLGNHSYHYVLSGLQNNKAVVLKLTPDNKTLNKEAIALKAFAGFGVVALLDQMNDALLLECAVPGHSLKSYWPEREEEAIKIACKSMKKLHQAPPPQEDVFPSIDEWLAALDKEWDIPAVYLKEARELKESLLKTRNETRLLHGDLHHDNILAHGEDWLIIDPKGVLGEQAYEVTTFIRNPIPELLDSEKALAILQNRIEMMAALLELDRQRIYKWCFVQAILSWIWNLEDGLDTAYFRQLATIFYSLLPRQA